MQSAAAGGHSPACTQELHVHGSIDLLDGLVHVLPCDQDPPGSGCRGGPALGPTGCSLLIGGVHGAAHQLQNPPYIPRGGSNLVRGRWREVGACDSPLSSLLPAPLLPSHTSSLLPAHPPSLPHISIFNHLLVEVCCCSLLPSISLHPPHTPTFLAAYSIACS